MCGEVVCLSEKMVCWGGGMCREVVCVGRWYV